jgi:hypothetical protein
VSAQKRHLSAASHKLGMPLTRVSRKIAGLKGHLKTRQLEFSDALRGRVLGQLEKEKVMSKVHREGAEIHEFSTVHGFVSLARSGPLGALLPATHFRNGLSPGSSP